MFTVISAGLTWAGASRAHWTSGYWPVCEMVPHSPSVTMAVHQTEVELVGEINQAVCRLCMDLNKNEENNP